MLCGKNFRTVFLLYRALTLVSVTEASTRVRNYMNIITSLKSQHCSRAKVTSIGVDNKLLVETMKVQHYWGDGKSMLEAGECSSELYRPDVR